MSVEENKAIVRRFVEAYNNHNACMKIVWGKRVPTPDLAFFKQLGLVEYTETGEKLFKQDAKSLLAR